MTKRTHIILGILIILLIAGAVLVREKKQTSVEPVTPPVPVTPTPPTVVPPTNPTPPMSPTTPYQKPEGWKTYENTKYKYSFSYPSSYYILQLEGIGVPSEITEDADNALVSEKEDISATIFSVQTTTLKGLDEEGIKSQAGATDPNNINLIKTTIADQPAYNLEFRKENTWETTGSYYVKNLYNQVIGITVSLNNDTADKILSSLRFIR